MEHTGDPDAKQFHFTVSWRGLGRMIAYGTASAVMTIGFAFGVASVVKDQTEQDTQEAVQVVVQQVVETQLLICGILKNADNPDIREAVRLYCPPVQPLQNPAGS